MTPWLGDCPMGERKKLLFARLKPHFPQDTVDITDSRVLIVSPLFNGLPEPGRYFRLPQVVLDDPGPFRYVLMTPGEVKAVALNTEPPAPERNLSIRRILLPKDTNPHGYIFGGVLLAEIDLAGSIEAKRYTNHPLVTRYMNGISFAHPVNVGDTVSFYTTLVKKGRTSLTVSVQVEVLRGTGKASEAVVATEVVYVAVERDDNGDFQPVPLED